MATTAASVFPFRIQPLNNIQPFTHREGMSHLQLLEKLRVYINDTMRGEFNTNFDYLLEELQAGIQNAEAVVLEAKAGWETVFAGYMLDVNASLMALNDTAMATLINDPATATGTALVDGFIQRIPARTVYVDPVNGDDDNSGESDDPLATVTEAIRMAERDAQTAATAWTIQLVAGTYTERVTTSAYTPFALNVTIQGPEVTPQGVPAVLFSEGIGTSAAAFKFENPMATFTLKYIKFKGYNGTSSSAGVNSSQGRLYVVTVSAEECFYGLSSIRGQIDVKRGGWFHNNGRLADGNGTGAAIRSLMLNRHSIGTQDAGNYAEAPRFTANRYGVQVQESSTGHIDWCEFEDNESAVVLRVNARANLSGSKFARNLTDVMADSNSHAFTTSSVVFGSGVDRSNQTIVATSGSRVTASGAAFTTASLSVSRALDVVYGKYNTQTVTGTTATTAVLTDTLLAPWWNDKPRVTGAPPKRLRVRAVGTLAGVAGTKQLILKVADRTSPITFAANETGSFIYDGTIIFADTDRLIIHGEANRNLADSPRVTVNTSTQDMSIDQLLTFSVTLENAADLVTLEYVELYYG